MRTWSDFDPMQASRSSHDFTKASAPSQPAELREQAEVMLREMQALDLFAQGRHAEAFALMDRAAALQGRMPRPIGRPMARVRDPLRRLKGCR